MSLSGWRLDLKSVLVDEMKTGDTFWQVSGFYSVKLAVEMTGDGNRD